MSYLAKGVRARAGYFNTDHIAVDSIEDFRRSREHVAAWERWAIAAGWQIHPYARYTRMRRAHR